MPTLRRMSFMDRVQRRLDHHRFAVDMVQAVLLAAVLAPLSFRLGPITSADGRAPLWVLALCLPLGWRRTRPVESAVAVFGVGLAQVLFGPWLIFPADLVVLVSLYAVTRHGPRWAGHAAMAAIVAGAGALGLRAVLMIGLGDGVNVGAPAGFFVVVCGLAVWTFALLRRSREETLAALRDRADRLERERDQQRQLAAADERARIAREMHDIVAHSLSVVIAQADGGRYVANQDPDAAVRVLGTISETGRAALADMRRILGVLRAGPDHAAAAAPERDGPPPLPAGVGAGPAATSAPAGAGGDGPELTPQPVSGDLDTLVTQVRAAGPRISLVRVGEPRPLPAGMGLTVYRICQEALTNVLKHAGPEPEVMVVQQWHDDRVVLEVVDDGRGASAHDDGDGHGLIGMRERVTLFGGELTAGPRDGGGFRVRAELPLDIVIAEERP